MTMTHQQDLKGVFTAKDLDFKPAGKITKKDLNTGVTKAEYAVRGAIPTRADELKEELKKNPEVLPFDDIINANIGNPQQLDQKPLTFTRQVLAILEYPEILRVGHNELASLNLFSRDALERAERLLNDIGGSIGAYSHSQGVPGIRQTVADFITRRDGGEPATPEDIYLTTGASSAATSLLSLLCKDSQTGLLIPIPQYPLYTASASLFNAQVLPYYLDEESNWSTNSDEIEKVVQDALKKQIRPSVLIVINPGNPTGAVLSEETIARICFIAAKYGITIISDEVYQENIFNDVKFHSMKKVLRKLQHLYPGKFDNVQLASLHSISKGFMGECGQRGGYMEIIGFSQEIRDALFKLMSISICSVVTGQAVVDLMVKPPQPGDESYEQDHDERLKIFHEMRTRANLLYETFKELEGIECQKPQGAMYLFPRLVLPKKALCESERLGIEPDEFYCTSLLESTGICTVPGSGFGQRPGTYHVRTTFLAPGTKWIQDWKEFHQDFFSKYRN
ncbi:ADQ_G0009770.mRNA.1.CDS.1 [Saccharomyces cerevisiae]|nr:ADQ_G0009770.mRNA.1.CDS.1 [Saccharomyces cerevisiae]CAI5248543.1 CMF_HP2_G0009700.mRNA.1.CDS.1 [Saccharomyces cerevisiae]CAI6429858.1 CMF_HP2_G0009700.mRNA.1.CDS.1 [Saccharomyces cerevisiae]CAI6431831.1 CMF_HP1_G0009950.mRNA.1.CDS.1 [Saccharomyces cerevisiae]CAI6557263.1 ADQ_G0009770.mRNA.1.CDS.1 [Saccharomyces cerevisiae]